LKIQFDRKLIQEARNQRTPIYVLARREFGLTRRDEQQISIHGKPDDESDPVIHALLLWLIKRDDKSAARLKEIVEAL
jgi:hypothetical protein